MRKSTGGTVVADAHSSISKRQLTGGSNRMEVREMMEGGRLLVRKSIMEGHSSLKHGMHTEGHHLNNSTVRMLVRSTMA